MFEARPLRRADRKMEDAAATALLERGEYCVLATATAAGLPLATPLSYVVVDGLVYFHCAMKGHKLDNLAQNPQVCLCVVGATQPVYAGNFTTAYESVVVHGTAALVEDTAQKTAVLMALCQKYLPQHMDKAAPDIEKSVTATAVVCVTPQQLSGKARVL